MTELGAIHEDVRCDQVAAADLAAELRSSATVLEGQVTERGNLRATARTYWQGRYGDEFDDRQTTCTGDATRLAASLRTAADNLDELARQAQAEQDRRVQAREWEASQDNGGGIGGFVSDVGDSIHDTFMGEDDIPPPGPPIEPPSIPVEDPGVVTRNVGAGGPAPSYGTGGVSSARPEDLDTWASASRGHDTTVSPHKSSLDTLHGDFTSTLGWGHFDASSLISAIGTWVQWNETDAQWATTIAQAFRDAGSGTVSDAVIDARLDAAGLDGPRQSVTYDNPSAWGQPPTSGYSDDPVNTANGNFVEAEVDLDAGGLCRLLQFTRSYNSRSDRVGAFGPGWSSWTSVRLRAEPDGAHWVGPDGQEVVIPRVPGGTNGSAYRRVAAVPGLVAQADEGGLVLEGIGGGSRLVFDAAGRPVVADDGPGTEVRFVHDGDRLVELRHGGGRTVVLEWSGDRVVAVRCSDGRAVTYSYDDAGRLVEAAGGPRGIRHYELDRDRDGGRIVAVVDADGVMEVYNRYDDDGRVIEQLSPFGRRSRYRYLGGRVTVVDDDAGGPANSYVHDDQGRLVGAIDGHGNELTKAYDEWGNPVRVTERDGSTTLQRWDDRARLVRRQAPDGSWFTFDHDELGRVVRVSASTGAATSYRYEGVERTPVEIVDPEGAVTRLEVRDGLVHRVVDPDGVEVRFGFDADGELTSLTDGLGNTATVERDAAGRVTATVSPMGRRTSLAYDDAGRLVARTDGDGAVWRYEWSAAGRPLAVVDPTGARREQRFGAHGEAEELVDELGYATTRRFDSLGNLVGVVLPDGAKWELDYDRLGRLTAASDPAGATWLREYDVTGHLVGTVDPSGTRRRTTLDGAGRLTRIHDGLTAVDFDHDPLGRAVTNRRPDGTSTQATYDLCGRITSVTDPEGGVTRYSYTPGGRLDAVTSPLGHVTRYSWDRAGRRIAVVNPGGQRWSRRLDGEGRVTQVVAPTGETVRFRYDAGGRLAARVSPADGTTRYEYDLAGRLVAVTSPTGGVTRYGWDARGQMVSAVDPNGGVTRYERDERGFLRAVVDALGGRAEHRHDAVGRLVESRDQLGRVTQWAYDPAGRLIQRVLPTGEQVRWWYDGSGRVRAIGGGAADRGGDGDERVRFERDLLGRPVVVDEVGYRHELEWSAAGRLVARRRNGVGLTWRYDADGRRVAIGHPDGTETTFGHDANGRVVGAAHPAVGTVAFEHDDAGRLVRRSSGRGSEQWTYRDGMLAAHAVSGGSGGSGDGGRSVTELERDAAGRVVAATTDGGGRTTYGYDPAGQLVGVAGDRGSWTFSYDAAGRLAGETGPDGAVGYTYDAAHQLRERRLGDSPTRYDYDRAGRRVSSTGPDGAVRDFRWDWHGDLAGVGDTNVRVDALGDLAEVDGMPLLWDPTEAVPQLRWVDGTAVVGDSEPWATVGRDGAVDWLAHDWQGSVGPAADPWGAPVDPSQARLGYRGELEVDGLLSLRNRAYDPSTRSFLSTDPLAATPGHPFAANPYHYAGNDPVGATDPLGLHPMSEADLAAYREAAADNGLFDHVANAWDATTGWVADNWEYLAAGALIVGGVLVMATGVGGPIGAAMIGGALLSGGISAGSQRLMTGQVNWGQVGVDMAIGGLAGGAGAWASGARFATTWGTASRSAMQIGVNTGADVTGGMVSRGAQGQNPFDPQAIAIDTLTGGVTGSVDVGANVLRNAHLNPNVPQVDPTPPIGDGPVTFRAPPGATPVEIAQVQDYVAGSNRALQNGDLSPTGRVSTQGELGLDASRAARAERARAAAAGTPYSGHAGHVPDTTWTGRPEPAEWMDLSPRVNTSLGGQAVHYPVGYRPTEFRFEQ